MSATSARYSRQIALAEIGREGQQRLLGASVLVVGAGGLGCAVLQCLVGAGVGRLLIADHDRVDESNLHRQPLYRMGDVGELKVVAACRALSAANPGVAMEPVSERLTPANVAGLVDEVDLVIDAADSFAVTYVLSDECRRAGKVLVSASVMEMSGYVGAFCGGAPSYRAVFPELPRRVGSCAGNGVLGSAVAVVGALQAQMALASILELQPPVLARLCTVDARTLRFATFSFQTAQEPEDPVPFIAPDDVLDTDCVIDLRSLAEAAQSPYRSALRLDVEQIAALREQLPRAEWAGRIVLCCRTGVRAWRAARSLREQGRKNLALVAFGD